jgi:hypothetical protein
MESGSAAQARRALALRQDKLDHFCVREGGRYRMDTVDGRLITAWGKAHGEVGADFYSFQGFRT